MTMFLLQATSSPGNPRLVYLDEPSTGLDPESRRQLWHAVLAAKQSKCIILTTHALEEAEALCDRVGIMTLGNPTPTPTLYPYPYPLPPTPYPLPPAPYSLPPPPSPTP